MYSKTVEWFVDSGKSCLEESTIPWAHIFVYDSSFLKHVANCAHKKFTKLTLLLLTKYYGLYLFFNDQKLNLIVPYNLDEEINKGGNKVIYH